MRTPTAPYRLLATLLYGRLDCLTRHPGGSLTVEVRGACEATGLRRAVRLHEAAERLRDWGLLEHLEWRGHYMVVRVRPPEVCGAPEA